MEYNLILDEISAALSVQPLDEAGGTVIRIGDKSVEVTIKALAPNHFHALIDGRSVNLYAAPCADGTWVWVDGRARLVKDGDAAQRRRYGGPEQGADAVTPPTPATVMRVVTEPGAKVTKGDPLVVVSAMKMELTLTAPYDGTVISVNVSEGAQVSPGDILVDVERDQEESDNE